MIFTLEAPLRLGKVEIYGLPPEEPRPLPGGDFIRGGRGTAIGAHNPPPGEGGQTPDTDQVNPGDVHEFIKLWTTQVPQDIYKTALENSSLRNDPRLSVEWRSDRGDNLLKWLRDKLIMGSDFSKWYIDQTVRLGACLSQIDLVPPINQFLKRFQAARLVVGFPPSQDIPLSDFGIDTISGEYGIFGPNPDARGVNIGLEQRHADFIFEGKRQALGAPLGFLLKEEDVFHRDIVRANEERFGKPGDFIQIVD